MVDDTRHGAGRVPPELRAWLDRLVREGSMLVEQVRGLSVDGLSYVLEQWIKARIEELFNKAPKLLIGPLV